MIEISHNNEWYISNKRNIIRELEGLSMDSIMTKEAKFGESQTE